MNHRLINYLVGIYLFFYFVLWGDANENTWIIIAFVLALIVSGISLTFNWFSTDGAFSALMVGTAALGLGQWTGAVPLLLFVAGSYSLAKYLSPSDTDTPYERRTGRQIWSNGFWFVLGIILWSFTGNLIWIVSAMGAIAVAASDTTATLTGSNNPSVKVVSILNFKPVPAGVDGGVSFPGTLWGFAAALIIALAATLLNPDFNLAVMIILIFAGFSGCILDSYLGAVFQYSNRAIRLPWNRQHAFYFSNNKVNLIATGWGEGISLLLYLLI